MSTYQIVEATKDSKIGYQPYGGAAELWLSKRHEAIIIGPAETGKTRGALEKLNALMWKYPKAQAAMVRKVYADMPGTCIQTFEKQVLGNTLSDNGAVQKWGGERPQFYEYANGSRIWIGGLDKPGKTLSSERDFIYINQVEDLLLEDFEILLTRATGRAGNAPYSQVFGDANPTVCSHWMYERQREDKLHLIQSKHRDNPTLYKNGRLTEQGKITMSILNGLSGVRRIRLRDGKCASVEGQVYLTWDRNVHYVEPFDIPESWRRIRVIDFGTTHPFVCGWFAIDEDERMYLYRQIYMTNRTVADHANQILEYDEDIEETICDHDAGDRLTLDSAGIPNIMANKDVATGIDKVLERLKIQVDGKARLYIFKDSLVEIDDMLRMAKKPYRVEDEFDNYLWANTQKEQPVKKDDHGMDMIRYGVMYLDSDSGVSVYVGGEKIA